jgi:hypothetical protein
METLHFISNGEDPYPYISHQIPNFNEKKRKRKEKKKKKLVKKKHLQVCFRIVGSQKILK